MFNIENTAYLYIKYAVLISLIIINHIAKHKIEMRNKIFL